MLRFSRGKTGKTDPQLAPLVALERIGFNFKGISALEIGGGAHLTCPKALVAREARHVMVTNPGHGLKDSSGSRISTKILSALELETLGETFDLIYGINVLEHVPNPAGMMEQIAKCLAPGGVVFLNGGPLWSSARGHHCWISVDDREYRFTDPDILKVIRPFEHLLNSRAELKEILSERVPREHAGTIVDHIFDSPHINRESHGTLLNALFGTRLSVLSYESRIFDNYAYAAAAESVRTRFTDGTDPYVMGFDIMLKAPGVGTGPVA